jgi:hypothetical protein
MKTVHWLLRSILPLGLALVLPALRAHGAPAFHATTNGFAFDTGIWNGRLQANGKSFGLVPVQQTADRLALARSMGWLAVYRVFSDGRRYGDGGWDWPHQSRLLPDGSALVSCPAQTNRPFDFTGQYTWRDAQTVDLQITVVPRQRLTGFEVFVASYFAPIFSNAITTIIPGPNANPTLTHPTREAAEWHMFPRRPDLAALIQDGRWKLEPHPVTWTLRPPFAFPIALRHAPTHGLTIAVLGDPTECFALAMPYETEGHYSLYLSLFGRDLAAGIPATARVRLQALKTPDWPDIVKAWQAFAPRPGDNSSAPAAPAQNR